MTVRQRPVRLAAWLALAAGLGSTLLAEPAGPIGPSGASDPPTSSTTLPSVTILPVEEPVSEEASERAREGTQLAETAGQFSLVGDRVAFLPNDREKRVICLENLALERVAAVVRESPDAVEWTVSGTITEYQGVNYLLLGRAVQRARAAE